MAIGLEPKSVGNCGVSLLATIQPGEQVRISAPYSNIQPNYYTINSYEHSFVDRKTTLNINKLALNVQNILKQTKQWGALESSSNPSSYDENISSMEYSWNLDFSVDSGTHTNTVIYGNLLRTDGSATGIWESDYNDIDSNVTAAVMKVNGERLSTVKIFVSFNGGLSYKQIYGQGVPSEQTIPSGSSLKIRVYLNSADTEIRSIALLYK